MNVKTKATPRGKGGLRARLRALAVDRSGATAVLAAILFPIVIGGMGLGAETGYHYYLQRQLQHAADVAAHGAAVGLQAGESGREAETATYIITQSGVPASALVHAGPPLSGALAGDAATVEVLLRRTEPRLFSAIFIKGDVVLEARAVANLTATGAGACLLALSENASGAITVTGNTRVNFDHCDAVTNSTARDAFKMSGNGRMSANCVYSAGGAAIDDLRDLTLTGCDAVVEGAPPVTDPYADIPEPTVNDPGVRVFTNGLHLNSNTHLDPGVYIIQGGEFRINGNTNVTGKGVTFYLTGTARLRINGNTNVNLEAPKEGPFAGILFFSSRRQTVSHEIRGNTEPTLQGAFYAPSSHVDFSGNSAAENGCTQIVASTVTFTGNSDSNLQADCAAMGGRDIVVNSTVRIIE